LFPVGIRCDPFRLGLLSVLSRPRPCGTGLSPRCRVSSFFSGNAKFGGTGVQQPFPLVELRLPLVDGPVPGISRPVPLISDLVSPVSNEIALVSGPCALLVA
jgi:hypothetical protein